MTTDYVLFIHGANAREGSNPLAFADGLFGLIKDHAYGKQSSAIEKVAFYWGDLYREQISDYTKASQGSPLWDKLWFKELRETQLIGIMNAAAVYTSRYVGSLFAGRLMERLLAALQGYDPKEDRLHLVIHGIGGVILFDILFSARWDPDYVPGHESVEVIRRGLFGVSPNARQGIRLGSISTMGSPIGFFSLMDVNQRMEDAKDANGNITCTHDISPRLESFLFSNYEDVEGRIFWNNFIHPGDPLAYPINESVLRLLDGHTQYYDLQDLIIDPLKSTSFTSFIQPFDQKILALGEAHQSYWQSKEVAQKIAEAIRRNVY
jgi:hypothetical protein